MNDYKTISIIVPVYKTEKYLCKCLESIITQTYEDFDLILIDDGSSDRCGELCDKIAKEDSRVKVIHQINSGVSAARNFGINISCGKYITFCDSDDMMRSDYLLNMINISDLYDLVISGYQIIDSEGKRKSVKEFNYHQYSKIKSDTAFQLIGECALSSVWGKRFKRSIIQCYDVHFDIELAFAEDTLFSIEYMINSQSILVLQDIYYYYRQYDDLTLGSYRHGIFQLSLKAEKKMLETVGKKYTGIEQSPQWKRRRWVILRNCLFGTLNNHELSFYEKKKTIKQIINDYSFPNTLFEIKESFPGEGNALVFVLRCRSSLLLIIFHELHQLKKEYCGRKNE